MAEEFGYTSITHSKSSTYSQSQAGPIGANPINVIDSR